MVSPLHTAKQVVDMASGEVRVSRIRRDPPPVLKAVKPVDHDERDARVVVIGILTFALAIFVIVMAFSSYAGWSPGNYTAHI
jgi:hypothetical protein